MIENEIFKKATADFNKIKKFGFKKTDDVWVFRKAFFDGTFEAVININDEGKVSGIVYNNGEEYLPLRVKHNAGGFSSKVRFEYEKILNDIFKNCFNKNLFESSQANRISDLIFEKYGIKPDFPWENQTQASDAGVFRKASGKWFALIMNIKKNKLIPKANGSFDIMNLKLDEAKIQTLIQKEGFFPAYHMNKKSWITISLDETLLDSRIMDFIGESYENVK